MTGYLKIARSKVKGPRRSGAPLKPLGLKSENFGLCQACVRLEPLS